MVLPRISPVSIASEIRHMQISAGRNPSGLPAECLSSMNRRVTHGFGHGTSLKNRATKAKATSPKT